MIGHLSHKCLVCNGTGILRNRIGGTTDCEECNGGGNITANHDYPNWIVPLLIRRWGGFRGWWYNVHIN